MNQSWQSSPSSKHQTWISSSSSIQKKPQGSAESEWVCGSRKKQPEYRQKFSGSFLSVKLWQAKINEDQQSIAKWTNPRASSHCLSGYTYILSKHHVSSEASGAAKHHMPFHKTVHKNTTCLCHQNVLSHASFSKTPLTRQLPKNITWHNWVFQGNPKFPLSERGASVFSKVFVWHWAEG